MAEDIRMGMRLASRLERCAFRPLPDGRVIVDVNALADLLAERRTGMDERMPDGDTARIVHDRILHGSPAEALDALLAAVSCEPVDGGPTGEGERTDGPESPVDDDADDAWWLWAVPERAVRRAALTAECELAVRLHNARDRMRTFRSEADRLGVRTSELACRMPHLDRLTAAVGRAERDGVALTVIDAFLIAFRWTSDGEPSCMLHDLLEDGNA